MYLLREVANKLNISEATIRYMERTGKVKLERQYNSKRERILTDEDIQKIRTARNGK